MCVLYIIFITKYSHKRYLLHKVKNEDAHKLREQKSERLKGYQNLLEVLVMLC